MSHILRLLSSPEGFSIWQPQIFLRSCFLQTACSAAYLLDPSSLAFQEGQEQINETSSFTQHWQITLFSCCFVFPRTLAYSFELKVTCFIWLLFFFFSVEN